MSTKPHWTAAVTEEGEPHSAFVDGHVPFAELTDTAEQIIAAFKAMDAELGDDVREHFAGEPPQLAHFWLREESDAYYFGHEGEGGTFPVTGVRFI